MAAAAVTSVAASSLVNRLRATELLRDDERSPPDTWHVDLDFRLFTAQASTRSSSGWLRSGQGSPHDLHRATPGQFYVVAYDGLDPLTGKERRRWHPAGHDRSDADALAVRLDTASIPPKIWGPDHRR